MKYLVSICFIIFFVQSIFSQEDETVLIKINMDSVRAEENPIYFIVDEMPEFNAGKNGLLKFYQEKSNYPVKLEEKGYKSVYYQIVIEKDGSVSDFEIVRGYSEKLDKETERIIKLMPNWKPGKKNDELVRVQKTLVINYDIK